MGLEFHQALFNVQLTIKISVSHDDLKYGSVIKIDQANYHISHLIYLMCL